MNGAVENTARVIRLLGETLPRDQLSGQIRYPVSQMSAANVTVMAFTHLYDCRLQIYSSHKLFCLFLVLFVRLLQVVGLFSFGRHPVLEEARSPSDDPLPVWATAIIIVGALLAFVTAAMFAYCYKHKRRQVNLLQVSHQLSSSASMLVCLASFPPVPFLVTQVWTAENSSPFPSHSTFPSSSAFHKNAFL